MSETDELLSRIDDLLYSWDDAASSTATDLDDDAWTEDGPVDPDIGMLGGLPDEFHRASTLAGTHMQRVVRAVAEHPGISAAEALRRAACPARSYPLIRRALDGGWLVAIDHGRGRPMMLFPS